MNDRLRNRIGNAAGVVTLILVAALVWLRH